MIEGEVNTPEWVTFAPQVRHGCVMETKSASLSYYLDLYLSRTLYVHFRCSWQVGIRLMR